MSDWSDWKAKKKLGTESMPFRHGDAGKGRLGDYIENRLTRGLGDTATRGETIKVPLRVSLSPHHRVQEHFQTTPRRRVTASWMIYFR